MLYQSRIFKSLGIYFSGLMLALLLAACGSEQTPQQAAVIAAPSTTVIATSSAATTAASVVTTADVNTPAALPTVTVGAATTNPATTIAPSTSAATATEPVTTVAPVSTTSNASQTVASTTVTVATVGTQPAGSNGKALLAVVDPNVALLVIDPTTKTVKSLLDGSELQPVGRPDWSTDANQLVVPVAAKGGKLSQLYLVSLSGNAPRKLLTAQPAESTDSEPKWSPDGKTIVFTRNTGGKHELWLVDRDGQNARKLTNGQQASWSPDSQRIAFITDGKVKTNIEAPQDNALHLISARGQNEWEPLSVAKMPTDLTAQGYPFGPDTLFIQYPVWLEGGKTIGFTTVGHSGLVGTVNSTTSKDLKVWDTQYEGGFGPTDSATGGGWLAYESYPPSGFAGASLVNVGGKPNLQKPATLNLDDPKKGILATHPALSADGSQVAYLRLTKDQFTGPDLKTLNGTLVVAQLRGDKLSSEKEIYKGPVQFIAWSK